MADSTSHGLRAALRVIDERVSNLEFQLQVAVAARESITKMLATLEGFEAPEPPATSPSAEPRSSVEDSPRLSLVDRLVQLIADSDAGTAWKAREFARALYDPDPTTSQVEGVRTYARRLVDRGLLVKNSDGSFTKVEVTG